MKQDFFQTARLRDDRGVSVVEFALIAPLLILLLWGSLAFSSSYTLWRRVALVASSSADLVARCNDVNNADLDDIRAAAALILRPFATDADNPTVQFVSASKDGNDNIVIDWSYPDTVDTATVDPALIDNGSSVIIATATYNAPPGSIQRMFETISVPGFPSFNAAPTTFTETFYAKPRRALKVNYSPNGEDCPE